MKLHRLTITGADDYTSVTEMREFSARYPFLEWGIQMSETRAGSPRYPSYNWIRGLVAEAQSAAECRDEERPMRLCGHLCGRLAGRIVNGTSASPASIERIRGVFARFQLNLNLDRVTVDWPAVGGGTLRNRSVILLMKEAGAKELAILTEATSNGIDAQVLFERSTGLGESGATWPLPFEHFFCGYGGGISTISIDDDLRDLKNVKQPTRGYWLDVRAGARTDGVLDFEKVASLCRDVAYTIDWQERVLEDWEELPDQCEIDLNLFGERGVSLDWPIMSNCGAGLTGDKYCSQGGIGGW